MESEQQVAPGQVLICRRSAGADARLRRGDLHRVPGWAGHVMTGTFERCIQAVAFSRGRDGLPIPGVEVPAYPKQSGVGSSLKM